MCKVSNLSKLKNEIFDKSSVTQVAHQGNTQVCYLARLLFVEKKRKRNLHHQN